MTERTCSWPKCKTKIDVDTSIENRTNFFVVGGWCDLHHKAYAISTAMEKVFCTKMNIDWPVGSLNYKKYKKELHALMAKAVWKAEAEINA